MDCKDAVAWVVSVCENHLRKSQVKTLSILVAATLTAMRLSLAAIGRSLAAQRDSSAKHCIKQAWRFITNTRVEPTLVMPQVMSRLFRRVIKHHRKHSSRRPLLISLDWTKVRSFHTLMAAIVVKGRALPLCWQSYGDRVQGRSQNALENTMLLNLRALLPDVKFVLLADRGFRRASLVELCQQLKIEYLIRICDDVIVKTSRWSGNLKHYPIRKGDSHGFANVQYRADGAVTTNLIVRWKRGLPIKSDGPWYLMTSLSIKGGRRRVHELTDLYALRFDIEELFRDTKNEHLGWCLGKTRVTKADRLDRLILITALAYVLLMAAGLWCRANRPGRLWSSNNRENELSAWAIGREMWRRIMVPLAAFIAVLIEAVKQVGGKWG